MRNFDWNNFFAHLIGSTIIVGLFMWAAIYRLDH